jgi:ankyrin repeat protein
MFASCRAGRESVRELLARGADPNARSNRGMTALIWAAYRDDEEPVHDLLTHGADPNARGPGGMTALMQAADSGSARCVPELLARTINVNSRDNAGRTALMLAVSWTNVRDPASGVSIVRQLLLHGGDPSLRDKSGATALTLARKTAPPAVVELLQHSGGSYVRNPGIAHPRPR